MNVCIVNRTGEHQGALPDIEFVERHFAIGVDERLLVYSLTLLIFSP